MAGPGAGASPREPTPRTDIIREVVGTGEGFVAVGSRDDPGTGTRGAIWTSREGTQWSVHEVGESGTALTDVATNGEASVAVGRRELDARNRGGRVGYPVAYHSVDAGRSWTGTRLPEPADSADFMTSLEEVVATPDGFLAGGAHFGGERWTYRSWIAASEDGSTWKVQAAPPLTRQLGGIQRLISSGTDVWAVQRSTGRDSSGIETYHASGDEWDRVGNSPGGGGCRGERWRGRGEQRDPGRVDL
ncbi:MAG: hypothetical protein ACK5LS_01665 [Propioniciclava sp.]